MALAACSRCPKPVAPAPRAPGCLAEPAPQEEPVAIAGPENGCPEQFVACLDLAAARALERNVTRARRWAREVEARCGAR